MILWRFLISWSVFPCRDCKLLSFANLLIWFPSTYNQLLDTQTKSHTVTIWRSARKRGDAAFRVFSSGIRRSIVAVQLSYRVDRWTNTKELLDLFPDECTSLGLFKTRYFQKWICFEKKVLLVLLNESDMPSTHRFTL